MLINQLLVTDTMPFVSIGCYSQKAEKKITYVFKENMVSNTKIHTGVSSGGNGEVMMSARVSFPVGVPGVFEQEVVK